MPNLDFDDCRDKKDYREKKPEKLERLAPSKLDNELESPENTLIISRHSTALAQVNPNELSEKTFEHGKCKNLDNEKEFRAETRKWINTLDIKERSAVMLYTGSFFYSSINRCLRESKIMNKVQKFVDNQLWKALEKSSLTRDLILYRKSINLELGEQKNKSLNDIIGEKVTLPAYSSTSTIPDRKLMGGDNRDLLWIIDAPKGSKAAYLKDTSLHRNESEVLLQKNTTLQIVGADIRREKEKEIKVIHAKIIN